MRVGFVVFVSAERRVASVLGRGAERNHHRERDYDVRVERVGERERR